MDKTCFHCKQNFKTTEEEMLMYQKVGVDPSDGCFNCRVAQHFSFWPFGKFRVGKSDFSGEQIITAYPPNTRFPIYTSKEWYSDVWDGLVYGQDYNSSRSFFDQMKELQEKIPRPHQAGSNNQNCEWSEDVWNSKNCYLSRSLEGCEDLYYGYRDLRCKNSIDLTFCFDMENSYDCTYCFKSYNLKYSINSKDCLDSCFLYDCRNCSNCFMSWNLRNKSYCIENVQYTREEYFKKIEDYNLSSRKEIEILKKQLKKYIQEEVVHKENYNVQVQNSTGDFIGQMNNCKNCFSFSEGEDLYSVVRGMHGVSSIDINGSWYITNSVNSTNCLNSYGVKHCLYSSARYSEYLDLCDDCENCFGCVGLKKKQYCILNKQYTKEAYHILKEKIVSDMKKNGEYGKFFPYEMSLLPYNLSTAIFYVPKTKEEIIKLGGYWFDGEMSQTNGISSSTIPDTLDDTEKDICKTAFICEKSGFRFNIAPNEFDFYKRYGIPLPNTHFDIRTKERLVIVSSITLSPSNCYFCKKDIETSYKKEWGYKKIACENCYKREVL